MSIFLRVTASILAAVLAVGPVSVATASAANSAVIAQTDATTGTLTGTVIDSSTNRPVAGATVNAQGGSALFKTTTQNDGSFSLTLPAGVYDITANKGGFQTATATGYPVLAGTTSSIQISLAEASSTSLRTIGRVSVTRASSINTSSASIATIDNAIIQQRDLPNLEDTVSTLPGVTLARTTSSTANLFFNVRGTWNETKVNIEGHPVSPGTFGTWNANYASSGIFNQVDVLKGAGLNGPTAGESVFGTINLTTRDFSPHNYVEIKGGLDSFAGSLYSVFANVNVLNDRLSLIVGKSFSGYNGPSDNYFANREGVNNMTATNFEGLGTVPTGYTALNQWQGDLSDRYSLEGELLKARYRLSPSTSISAEFLGLQGQYSPQAGSYASLDGNAIIAPCFNGSTIGTGAGGASPCSVTSNYNAPYTQSQIGQTSSQYSFFPSSYIQNNEPEFTAELRTSLKNDTILLRPYVAMINRFISGVNEVNYPGNGSCGNNAACTASSGWYQVTNVANCQEQFVNPSVANGGAKGPCFGQNMIYNSPAYIGAAAPAFPFGPPMTSVAPTCTPGNPCWTTITAQANNGTFSYGTPFSQPEIDRLRGVTFQYLHPFGDNLLTFSYDYHSDDTFSTTGDTTIPFAGCQAVVGSVATNTPALGIGYQPGCGLSFLPRTSIAIPPTKIRDSDYALTGLFQVTPKLQLGIGAYYEYYNSLAQTENPALLNQYALPVASGGAGTASAAPVSLVTVANQYSHFDPHFGLVYRPTPDIALRATAGSAVTMPYASLISGLGSVTIPNGSNNEQYTVALANTNLLPESTVAYDVGFDVRLPNRTILSMDGFNNTIHNVFMGQTIQITCPSQFVVSAAGGCFQSLTLNGPEARFYGVEASLNRIVPEGFGYILTATLERAFYWELPASLYNSGAIALINGEQFNAFTGAAGTPGSVPFAKGYGELRWSGPKHQLFTLGMDYEGSNNSTYAPAYFLFNSTTQFDVIPNTTFQMAIDNLFNLNNSQQIVRALFGQGPRLIGINGSSGSLVYTTIGSPRSIQALNPRTVRFTLTHRFGQ